MRGSSWSQRRAQPSRVRGGKQRNVLRFSKISSLAKKSPFRFSRFGWLLPTSSEMLGDDKGSGSSGDPMQCFCLPQEQARAHSFHPAWFVVPWHLERPSGSCTHCLQGCLGHRASASGYGYRPRFPLAGKLEICFLRIIGALLAPSQPSVPITDPFIMGHQSGLEERSIFFNGKGTRGVRRQTIALVMCRLPGAEQGLVSSPAFVAVTIQCSHSGAPRPHFSSLGRKGRRQPHLGGHLPCSRGGRPQLSHSR